VAKSADRHCMQIRGSLTHKGVAGMYIRKDVVYIHAEQR